VTLIKEFTMEEKAKEVAELLKILANENRLMILCILMEQPRTVSEISSVVSNITQSALSQHLSLLKTCGILASKRSGMNMIYSIKDHRVEKLIEVLKESYC